MCIILPAPSDRRQTAPCSVKFGLKLDVSVLGWTGYSRLFKDERPQWKQRVNDKTTH